jgi:hypothetical protein
MVGQALLIAHCFPCIVKIDISFIYFFGDLAQLVEHLICIQRVRSSSLLTSIEFKAVIAQLVRARH